MSRAVITAFGLFVASSTACSVDDRVLESSDCSDAHCGTGGATAHGGSAASEGGKSASGGRTAGRGGTANSGGAETEGGAGSTDGEGGNAIVDIACPDLDQNTVPDCSETLVVNATFDKDIDGWRSQTYATASWDFVNAQAGEKSGSIFLENSAPADATSGSGFIYTGVNQCLAIDGEGQHQIFAQVFNDGELVTGYGSVVARLFTSADCKGTPVSVVASPNLGNTGNWFTVQTSVFPTDASVQSVMVELRAGKLSTRTGAVSLRFDNVMVR
jgi:hypothetical protein